MSSARISFFQRWNWRTLAFVIVDGLLVVFLLYEGALALLAPWVLLEPAPLSYSPQFVRWYVAQMGALACILGCGCLLALLWKPGEKPLLAQFVGMAFVLFTLIVLVFFASNLTVLLIAAIVVMCLFVVTYPRPRSLVSFSREGALSIPLVVLSLVAAVLLAPIAWYDLTQQIRFPVTGYAQSGEWMYSFMLALLLVLGGLLSATKRAGWNVLGILIGVTLLYLGVAAFVTAGSPGSWGTVGGILAVLGGVAYISFTCYEMWNVAKPPAEAVSPPVPPQE